MADNQWQELMRDWQTADLESSEQKNAQLDVKALEQKTRRKARNMSMFMWFDIIAGIGFMAFFLYMFMTGGINSFQATIFTAMSVILVPMVFYSVWVRRGLWHANGNTTQAYLELNCQRARAGMRLARANIFVSYLVFPFLIALLIWKMVTTEVELNWPFNALVFVTLFQVLLFSIVYFGSKRYYRAKESELQQTTQLLAELEGSED